MAGCVWTLERVLAVGEAAGVAGLSLGTSYRQPVVLCGGSFLARLLDPDILVVRCALEEKAMLMAAAPEIFFETPHYRGWPAVLVRLDQADEAMIGARLRAGAAGLARKGRQRGRARGADGK